MFEIFASCLPLSAFHRFVFYLGNWRPKSYHSIVNELVSNLSLYFPESHGSICKNILRLETRMVAENIFITRNENKVKASFKSPLSYLPAPSIIVSGHLFNFWLLIELLRIEGMPVVFVMGRKPDPKRINEKSGWRAWKRWRSVQEFIYVNEGNAYEKCQKVLESGKRLFILLDAPRKGGFKTRLLGKEISVAAGGLKLAEKFKVPIRALLPYPPYVSSPYFFILKELKGTYQEVLDGFTKLLEKTIISHPFSWTGWVYLKELVAH